MLEVADRLSIHELLGLYGHIIDQRRWSEMESVFTVDVTYDATDFGAGVTHGVDALREAWSTNLETHPLAHHATNIVISEDADGTVRVLSKGLGVGFRGRVGSAVYEDVVVRTAEGWRLAYRRSTLRRPDGAASTVAGSARA